MRVLIFSQYFTPEVGATQTRVHTFAAGLAARGHDVEVICEVPNHPQGVVHRGYGRRALVRRTVDGFKVTHLWVRTSRVKTMRTRLELYGSYAAMAMLVGAAARRPDVVFASSPPLPVAAAAAAVAARHRVPWVMDVRDLWPEAAVAMGELSNPRLLRMAERLERRLYGNAAAVTAVTEPFVRSIRAKVGNPEKVSLLPNGTTRFWLDGAALEPDRRALGVSSDTFLWTYAGNVGAAQGLESAVDAAERLGNGFELLILGDGPARSGLEQRAGGLRNGNILFRDQVQPESALRYLRSSDALIVPLADDPALRAFVPSKLFDFCAVGRPVVLIAAGEPQRLTAQAGATLYASPGDPDALAETIRNLRADPSLRDSLSTAGRAFAAAHDRQHNVARLAELLESVAC